MARRQAKELKYAVVKVPGWVLNVKFLFPKLGLLFLVFLVLFSLYFNYSLKNELYVYKNRLYETEERLRQKGDELKSMTEEKEINEAGYQVMTYYASKLEEVSDENQYVVQSLAKFSTKQMEANDTSKTMTNELLSALECGYGDIDCIRTYVLRSYDSAKIRNTLQSEADQYLEEFSEHYTKLEKLKEEVDQFVSALTESY